MNVKLRRIFGGNLDDEIVVLCWPFLIGRAGDCHLRPGCPSVSRRHCALIANGDRVTVRDLGSRNGTFVNDDQVLFERDLATGDKLTMGLCMLEVVIEPAVPSCSFPRSAWERPRGISRPRSGICSVGTRVVPAGGGQGATLDQPTFPQPRLKASS